jgi:hypothetical protein
MRENRNLMEGEGTLVYRSQGSVGIIDLIKTLPEDLRQYERNVISGKCKKIEETL